MGCEDSPKRGWWVDGVVTHVETEKGGTVSYRTRDGKTTTYASPHCIVIVARVLRQRWYWPVQDFRMCVVHPQNGVSMEYRIMCQIHRHFGFKLRLIKLVRWENLKAFINERGYPDYDECAHYVFVS